MWKENRKIQHKIQGGPESPFTVIYMEQTSVKKRKKAERPYEGVLEHILG